MYEVQFIVEGFFDPSAKTDSRFLGTLDECKNYLKEITVELEKQKVFYGVFADELTLEIKRKEDNESTFEKYIIINLF